MFTRLIIGFFALASSLVSADFMFSYDKPLTEKTLKTF